MSSKFLMGKRILLMMRQPDRNTDRQTENQTYRETDIQRNRDGRTDIVRQKDG